MTDPDAAPAPSPAPDVADFRAAMGRYATGVVVVTTRHDGLDHAMTANSFTSVSLDPMLALVCVERASRFHAAILGGGSWGVSVLAEHQGGLARWLATPGRALAGQLDGVPLRRGTSGVALLAEALATVELATVAVHPAGDHDIVLGEVIGLGEVNLQGVPLVYWSRRFGGLAVDPA